MRDITSVIYKNVSEYQDIINHYSNSRRIHHFSNRTGAFPTLLIDNCDYYEQSFFDELIENNIWKHLVNGVLKDLFSTEYCSEKGIVCEWAKMHLQLTSSYVREIERRYPIEFTIIRNGKRIGYRYTFCYNTKEELDLIFNNKKLSEMIIIDFSSKEKSAFWHPFKVYDEYKDRIKRVPLKDFFGEYFTESEYYIYLAEVRKAVEESYNHVGLQTISNLSFQELPVFQETEVTEIKSFPYESNTYVIVNKMKDKAATWYGDGIIPGEDLSAIRMGFFQESRYLALVGSEHFSKSFITSEYLYHTLKHNNHFDYTAIVSGYLKSIEQLLFKTLEIILTDGHKEDLWIQSRTRLNSKKARKKSTEFRQNPEDKNRTQVKVAISNKDDFDTSFAALVHMIKDYNNGWSISTKAISVISALLLTYCDECRNEHFHKDNINDISEVEIIRNNTFQLLYYVIGGFDYSKNATDSSVLLGRVSNDFDRMYRAVMRFGSGNYYLIKFSAEDPILVALPIEWNSPQYDENGLMKNASLRFVKLNRSINDDWHIDDWGSIQDTYSGDSVLYLSRNNMPESITYINKLTNENIEIEW